MRLCGNLANQHYAKPLYKQDCRIYVIPLGEGGGGRVVTPSQELYEYVPPKRVMFLGLQSRMGY